LRGVLPTEHLLAAESEQLLESIMDADPKIVDGCDQEATAWRMIEHGQASVAVVDTDGRFGGLISPHAMVSALLAEHDESLARLGGYLAGSQRARLAAQEECDPTTLAPAPVADRGPRRDHALRSDRQRL